MRSIFYRQCLLLNNSYFLQSQYRLQLSWVQKAFFSSSSFANTRAANPDPYVSSPSLLPNIISSSLSSPPSFIMQTSADATGVTIIDGKATADTIREELKVRVDRLSTSAGRAPGLAVVLVGSRPDSATYVRMKKKACAEAGIVDFGRDLPGDASEEDILRVVRELNADPRVDGILVQLPLPSGIKEETILDAISFEKDADGLHPLNAGFLALKGREPLSTACTPKGCLELLKRNKIPIAGKNAVVLGRSNIVGVPVAALLQRENATVTVCHSRTADIASHVRNADIVVAAIGQPLFLKGEWLKPGAVVIDVGINQVKDDTKKSGFRLVGDVDFDSCILPNRASAITPVPGGVGPMTIAMLLTNTVDLFERRIKDSSSSLQKTSTTVVDESIFDKIIAGKIPSTKVFEDDLCYAFRDISPCAPTHVLLVPKNRGRLDQLQHSNASDEPILGHLLRMAGEIAKQEKLGDGYRVVINDGKLGCQTVFHLHLHIIGGTQLSWPPTGLGGVGK
jgi:5,10-methylene-tetrahydrofolate dehydrogenase/methenyl tetrahydrofolate cyclohydrolase/diadenosine tetraphosphate (Ap4A) HIT family hydrolase